MKKAITNIWRFLLGFTLMLTGIVLLAIVKVVAIFFYFATLKRKRQNAGEILTGNGYMFKQTGKGYDLLGNIVGGQLFSWMFLKQPLQFPFGISGEMISTVLELNFKIENLNKHGIRLRDLLGELEFDHCEKSLEFDINKALNFIEKYKKIQVKFETMERTKEFMAKYN